VLQVNVGAQVNGRVARVHVDFNSVVKKGDLLAEIDPVLYGSQVSQASAQVAARKAELESARANAAAQKLAFERVERLFAQSLASKGEVDAQRGQYEVARAQVAAVEAQITAVQAQLAQQQTNVGWTKIYSPVDGIVVSRAIDPGATVVASFQAPVLFVIAQDLRKMRVLADIDEADVGKLREDVNADAVVDAFPGDVFRGRVAQVRFSPNNVQGVVTYSAVVEVENPDEKLRPGMTATVTIKTREAKQARLIPNAALRYKPEKREKPGKPEKPESAPAGQAVAAAPMQPEAPLPKGAGRIYVVVSDRPGQEAIEPRIVQIGITDGISTEVTSGLDLGTKVVTDELDEADKKKKGKIF